MNKEHFESLVHRLRFHDNIPLPKSYNRANHKVKVICFPLILYSIALCPIAGIIADMFFKTKCKYLYRMICAVNLAAFIEFA